MMGEHRAEFPSGLLYATNHMWARPQASPPDDPPGQRLRFGLSAYAVRLLQDVYFLDWQVEPPVQLARRQTIGSIESKKAESDLFAPAPGRLIAVNSEALDDPSVINVDPYGAGWLVEMIVQEDHDLLDLDGYLQHLEQAWPLAQRTIKGQV